MTKRRSFTAEFKARVVIEDLMGIKDRAELCREHRLRPQLLGRWRREFMERAPELFSSERQGEKEQARIAELERMVGRLTMELDMAKKASDVLSSLSNGRGR